MCSHRDPLRVGQTTLPCPTGLSCDSILYTRQLGLPQIRGVTPWDEPRHYLLQRVVWEGRSSL